MSATAATAARASASSAHVPFQFYTTAGMALLRTILRTYLPFDPHDFLLAWTALLLDGNHILGITATGDGKSCMFYFALLVIQHFARQLEKPACWSWPDNPLVLVICPTKGIEEEQAADMERLKIPALAINEDRLKDARQRGIDLWALVRLTCMLFISPELLASAGFAALLADAALRDRIVLAFVDEAHLVLEWSRDFRKAFLQIGHLLSRLCPKARICALSATVLPGAEKALCKALGVFWDDIHIMRRSNLRANIQFERRPMTSALSARAFPELQWVIGEQQTVLIFVDSIRTSWRVAAYLCRLLPHLDYEARRRRIRIYNALNTAAHNEHTRQLLHGCQGTIAIATNALCVGFSPSGVDTVIMLDAKTLDEVLQKGGRANRKAGSTTIGRAILYTSQATRREAAALIAADDGGRGVASVKKSTSKKARQPIDVHLARFITGPCVETIIDAEYRNPRQQPCYCSTCGGQPISGVRRTCACDDRNCQRHGTAPSTVDDASKSKRPRAPPRLVSKEMEETIVALLYTLRSEWYLAAPAEDVAHLPECAIFPEDLMRVVAGQVLSLDSVEKIRDVVADCEFVVERVEELQAHLEIVQLELTRKPRGRPAGRVSHHPESESDSDSSTASSGASCASDDDQPMTADLPVRQPLADVANISRAASSAAGSKRRAPSNTNVQPKKRTRTTEDEENLPTSSSSRGKRPAAQRAVLAMRNMV